MKLLDLFSGMCGFSHAAERHGFFTTAFCEIDKFCHRVIQKHYPDRPLYTDIRDINGGEIEPVDVVTFGSPCQNLSVAGKQDGLKGKQSSLFYEAIRIMREMREKTDGLYPRYAVWENVPGAFSSNKRQDFRAVLEEITQAEIPMPKSGRWANAGMVRGEGYSVAWRNLDAQYWGVPQRRKRIFLVADFRGQSAPEILFECEGMSGDITESGKEGQGTAADIGEGVTCPRDGVQGQSGTVEQFVFENHSQDTRYKGPLEVAQPVTATYGMGGNNQPFVVKATSQGDNYSVRRLTPIECLRLQGFPDDWLDGLKLSDTAKYRMAGNSVAIPCVEFVMKRIAESDTNGRNYPPHRTRAVGDRRLPY